MRIVVAAKVILTTTAVIPEGLRAEDIILAAEQKLNGLPLFVYPEKADAEMLTQYGVRVHLDEIEQVT